MVVVFGSINLDLVAGVQRLPRPGETLTARAFGSSPGGKGANQALAARRAGAQVALYGAVGNDNFANAALALLREDHVDLAGVRIVAAPTGVALIHLDEAGENSITLVPGANALTIPDWVPQPRTAKASRCMHPRSTSSTPSARATHLSAHWRPRSISARRSSEHSRKASRPVRSHARATVRKRRCRRMRRSRRLRIRSQSYSRHERIGTICQTGKMTRSGTYMENQ